MPIPETITYQEAAARYNCSARSIMRAIVDRGLIAAYKPGRHVLIDVKSGDDWWLSTAQQPKVAIRRRRR